MIFKNTHLYPHLVIRSFPRQQKIKQAEASKFLNYENGVLI